MAATSSTSSKIAVSDELVAQWKDMKQKRSCRWMTFKLDQGSFRLDVDKTGPPSSDAAAFAKALPDGDSRYGVFDLPVTNKYGGSGSKLIFFMWAPATAGRNNLFYASQRKGLVGVFQGVEDKQVTTRKAVQDALGGGAKDDGDGDDFDPDA
jgi:cofilin